MSWRRRSVEILSGWGDPPAPLVVVLDVLSLVPLLAPLLVSEAVTARTALTLNLEVALPPHLALSSLHPSFHAGTAKVKGLLNLTNVIGNVKKIKY